MDMTMTPLCTTFQQLSELIQQVRRSVGEMTLKTPGCQSLSASHHLLDSLVKSDF